MHLIHSAPVDGVGNTARAVIRYPGRVEAMRLTRAQIVDGTGFAPDATFEQVTDYNGWSNRETWAVALHINNDQGWQEQIHELLRETFSAISGAVHPQIARQAGEIIREHFEEIVGNAAEAPAEYLTRDLFMALQDIGSLRRVDWDEIGGAFLSDIAEES